MKKKVVVGIVMLMIALAGCGAEGDSTENDLNTMEQIEGYEGLSDEEVNQKLIEEADKMEVVPDKTE